MLHRIAVLQQPVTMLWSLRANAHHVVDETSEEAPAAKVGVVGLQVGSLRAHHLLQGSSSSRRKSERHKVEGAVS